MAPAPERKPQSLLRRLPLYGIVGCCLLIVAQTWLVTLYQIDKQERSFHENAARVANDLVNRLAASTAICHSLRAFYDASDYVSPDEFAIFSTETFRNFDFVIGALYAPRVADTARDSFELRLGSVDTPHPITTLNSQGILSPSPARNHYFPVQYLQIKQGIDRSIIGLDLLDAWRDIVAEAIASDTVLAAPLRYNATQTQNQFSLLVPIYQKNHTANVDNQAIGLSAVVIDKDLLLNFSSLPDNIRSLHLQLSDMSALDFATKLRSSPAHLLELRDATFTRNYVLGNQKLALRLEGTIWLDTGNLVRILIAALAGLCVAFAIYWVLRALTRRTRGDGK